MMTRRDLRLSALAISTSCCWASDSRATGVVGENVAPSRSRNGWTALLQLVVVDQLQKAVLPRLAADEDVGGDVRLSKRLSSWWTKAMPAAIDSATVSDECATPSISMVPRSGSITPPRIFIRVDLPAPFSPTRPMTSPGRTSMLKSASATTPG